MSLLPAGYRIVEVGAPRRAEFLDVDRTAFAMSPSAEVDAVVPFTVPDDRTMAVQAPDGTLAAVHGSYPFTLPVPGGALPCAGLTWVGVRPDERRRGLLTAMIDVHVERSLGRGESVSALFAAEAAIYGRFGYGCAADDVQATVPRGAALRPVAGSERLTVRFDAVDEATHGPLVHQVHVAAGVGRPGWITRPTDALRRRVIVDPSPWRHGAEPLRLVSVHAPDGEPRAYALLARMEHWDRSVPAYTVAMREAAAVDAAAAHRLWSFVLDLDLVATVDTPLLAPDDPLLTLLVDRRSARPRLTDNLWLRLLDVPTALAGRRYAAPLDVVIEVTDARLPANAGRWRLTTQTVTEADASDDRTGWPATVTTTDAQADLVLDVRELGAAYLGGRSLTDLARAGLVEECTAGAATRAGAAFGWPVAPVCSWVF